MPTQALFYARIFSHERVSSGAIQFMIEYASLASPARSGKASIGLTDMVNERKMTDDLKDALAEFLETKYSITVRNRDIVGLGL
jgi:hypothetical protein